MSVITVDQIVSGASNVLAALLAAHVLGVAAFGLFGIVFVVYIILIGVTRALVSDPVLVHPVEAEERVGEVVGATCMLALGLAAGLLAVGVVLRIAAEHALGNGLIVLALCLPLLVAQDLGRYLSFADRRPGFAVVLDAVWLALWFGGIAALLLTDTRTLVAFIGVWAGSGALAGTLLFWRHRPRLVRLGSSWLRYTWPFSWRFLISYTSTQGGALGVLSGVGAFAGARAVGGVNGAVLMARPLTTFQVAATAATIGEVARSDAQRSDVRRRAMNATSLCVAVALANGLAMVLLPGDLGRLVLGHSWHAARPLLLPTAVQILFMALLTGPQAGLLGLRAIRRTMAINVASLVVVVAATLTGVIVFGGALGALWAIAVGQGLLMIAWWAAFISQTGRTPIAETTAAVRTLPPVTVASPPAP